jgi:hypothetical protein
VSPFDLIGYVLLWGFVFFGFLYQIGGILSRNKLSLISNLPMIGIQSESYNSQILDFIFRDIEIKVLDNNPF